MEQHGIDHGAAARLRDAFLARNVIVVKTGMHDLPYLKLTMPPLGVAGPSA